MGEPALYKFSFRELAESLIKHQGLTEGFWQVYFEFAIGAMNGGPSQEELMPTAMVPIVSVGIRRVTEMNNLTADAAQVGKAKGPVARVLEEHFQKPQS